MNDRVSIKSVYEPVSLETWDEVLKQASKKGDSISFFQSPLWAQILVSAYPNYEIATKLFVFSDGQQALLPLIKVKKLAGLGYTYHSMPFHTYGGLVFPTVVEKQKLQQYLQTVAEQLLHEEKVLKVDLVIFPLSFLYSEDKDKYKMAEMNLENFKTFFQTTQILYLKKGYEWIWENKFTSKNRNCIRKAIKSGVEVTLSRDSSDFKSYFLIWKESQKTKKLKTKIKLYTKHFFESLAKQNHPAIRLYLAKFHGEVISGIIVFAYGNNAMYWQSATLSDFRKLGANNLLLDRAIKDACAENLEYFDFGASPNLPKVKQFKSAFGPEEVTYPIYNYASRLVRLVKKIKN